MGPIVKLSEYPGSKLIDLPDVIQPDDYSCGAAVAMSVGKFLGVGPSTLDEWKRKLGTTRKTSTLPNSIYEFFKGLGCQVSFGENLTIDDLRQSWHKGNPVICPIQEYMSGGVKSKDSYGHYVAVIGVDLGMIFVQDPSEDNVVRPEKEDSDNAPGRAMIEEKKWLDVWHDRDYKGRKYNQCGIAIGPPKGRRQFGDLS